MANDRKPKRRLARTKLGVMDAKQVEQNLAGKIVMDRYLIEAEIGSGAMGTVYRGRHVKLQRSVAIKVLHQDFAGNRTMLARFRREAEAAARLHHPNVSGVLDVGESPDGHQLMVMDLVEGKSLRDLMDEGLSPGRIVNLVRQILAGLDHAHAAGLVHRDMKPDNVIVELDHHGQEVPRIVDFGIAALRTEDTAAMSRLTETGTLLGTPLYMAPEQARGEQVDRRADLFALGVILFEMLAGKMPFEGSALEIVIANMTRISRRSRSARRTPTPTRCSSCSCAGSPRASCRGGSRAPRTRWRCSTSSSVIRWRPRSCSARPTSPARSPSSGCRADRSIERGRSRPLYRGRAAIFTPPRVASRG